MKPLDATKQVLNGDDLKILKDDRCIHNIYIGVAGGGDLVMG